MGRSRYKIYDTRYPCFITGTCIRWLPLFSNPDNASIFMNTIRYLQESQSLQIFAWVMMENHFHMIARSSDLPKTVAILKSYSGKRVVESLEEKKNYGLLQELSFGKKPHKTKQNFQVWQEGCHREGIFDRSVMTQKVEYIHNTPVQRGFVDFPDQWRYSSARDYSGGTGLITVVTGW
ncbi:REP-associated tyrosine transposase [Chitinivibrio alkaliphilus]|uniref:Transposase IS200-like domain-containing protein n=1 Tax=Chitinivibrio alkaliphilus ACht1 TaxID=1313304 RepID=U7D8K2_9BACT|nr:transposase [Chitinivibrio alkaliphilus]ERP31886.1 hypothetical protein CALK_1101 [Chitinivibrio alkaliphilus ACht1]